MGERMEQKIIKDYIEGKCPKCKRDMVKASYDGLDMDNKKMYEYYVCRHCGSLVTQEYNVEYVCTYTTLVVSE